MRGIRLDRVLASTALALVLAVSHGAVAAERDGIEARVPLPDVADLPPPTAADISPVVGAGATTPAPDNAAMAQPEPQLRGATVAHPVAMEPTQEAAAPEPIPTATAVEPAPATTVAEPAAGAPVEPAKDAAAPAESSPAQSAAAPAESAPAAPAPVEAAKAPEPAPSIAAPVQIAPAPAQEAAAPSPAEPATTAAPAANEPASVATIPPQTPAPEGAGAAPAPASEATPALATADPTTEALRTLVTGRIDRIFDRKKEREAVIAFYTARDFAPLWIENGAANERAKRAIAHLGVAEADGLDPADYPTPEFKPDTTPSALAEAELRLTDAVITYARHASDGRVHYSRVSADVGYTHQPIEAAEILNRVAGANDVAAALDGFNPQQPGYKALKAKLAELRGQTGQAEPLRIASGPVLRVGKDKRGNPVAMQDPRVPLLRERLGVPAGAADDTTYDKTLADAVANFQRQKGLSPNGQLNAATVDALNGRRQSRDLDIIRANMERWRWLPHDLGKAYVMLNIPDYTLKVVNNGQTIWTTRVVVGKPSTATPILTETMKYITVNPTWNVPPSIIYNEYLPALQQDPTVLSRMGLKLTQNRDGSVHISQPPGERNALGRIRFNFPNKFLVYQHDTPDKNLFAHDKRAYSHGCMRVQDPAKYAEVLLSIALPKEGYTQERIKKMYGSSEININFPQPIPVHITYQTAFVDDAGKLQIRDDIYSRDTRVLAALKDERRVADLPVDRPKPNYSRPPARLPAGVADSGFYRPSSGPSFFEQLFGIGPATPPAPVRGRRTSSR